MSWKMAGKVLSFPWDEEELIKIQRGRNKDCIHAFIFFFFFFQQVERPQ